MVLDPLNRTTQTIDPVGATNTSILDPGDLTVGTVNGLGVLSQHFRPRESMELLMFTKL